MSSSTSTPVTTNLRSSEEENENSLKWRIFIFITKAYRGVKTLSQLPDILTSLLSCSSYTVLSVQFSSNLLDLSDNVLYDWLFPHHCFYSYINDNSIALLQWRRLSPKRTICILTCNFQPPIQQKLWNIHLQFLYAKDMNQSHDMSHDIYTHCMILTCNTLFMYTSHIEYICMLRLLDGN